MKWTQEQTKFLTENYYLRGGRWCATKLNLTWEQVSGKAERLKLKIRDDLRFRLDRIAHLQPEDRKINPDQFKNPSTPEICYILGLIWADGHIRKDDYKSAISIMTSDMNHLLSVFLKIGNWSIREYQPVNPKAKPQTILSCCNKPLFYFFQEFDYIIKSGTSPDKILNIIPEHLRHYWWRGYFDGDGCLYLRDNKPDKGLSMASTINQNWTFLDKLCSYLDIKNSRIETQKHKTGSSSKFCLSSFDSIKKFLDYIYDNYENDKIGLPRKYQKYLSFLMRYEIFQENSLIKYRPNLKKYNDSRKKLGAQCAPV